MYQKKRHEAVLNLINELEAGGFGPPTSINGPRVVTEAHLSSARAGCCVVCGVQLIGRQELLCSGHWDYLVFDQSRIRPFAAYLITLVDSLQIAVSGLFVVRTQTHWMGAVKGRSRCEVCDIVTVNIEALRNGDGETIKSHTVCEAHCSFRWEEPI